MSLSAKPAKNEMSLGQLSRLNMSGWLDAATYEREADRRPPDSILDRVFDNAIFVEVRNTGSQCDEYQPLEIIDCAIPPGSGRPWIIENTVLDCQAPTGGTPRHNFVIPLQPMRSNQIGQAVITGLVACKVYFSATNLTWCRRCDMEANRSTLAATPEGSAEIVWRDITATIPGDVDCIVNLAPAVDVTYQAVAVGDIPHDSSGTASIYQNNADTTYQVSPVFLDHMEGDLDVSSGKELKITWYHMEKRWAVDGAECEDNPPAVGQIVDDNTQPTQSITTTPAPINAFVAGQPQELNTPNVTLNPAAASITLPDVPSPGHVYRINVNLQITPGSNNNTYNIWTYINGVQQTPPLMSIDGRQSGTTLTASVAGLVALTPQSAPTLQLQVSTASGSDTATWNSTIYSLERNLDF